MMRRLDAHPARSRRGSVVIFFLVFALPLLLTAASLAWDATRLEVARRQLDAATNSAAVSAAWAVDPNSAPDAAPRLDPALTTAAALQTYCMNWVYVLSVPAPPGGEKPRLYDCSHIDDAAAAANKWGLTVNTGNSSVKVIGQARVPNLLLMKLLMPGAGDPTIVSYATANTCMAATADQGCARPFPGA